MGQRGGSRPHCAPPRQLVEAVRARYPEWAKLGLDTAAAARQHPLPWLLKTIEDLYDQRYAHDVAELEYVAGEGLDPEMRGAVEDLMGAHPFPDFVVRACGRHYGVRALAEKAAWEVMCNAEAARSARLHPSVELFCAFCNRGYDDEELMFFLYCRQTLLVECARCVPKGSMKTPKGADQRYLAGAPVPPLPPAIALTERRARNITATIFGGGGGMLYQAVMQLVGDHFARAREAAGGEGAGSKPGGSSSASAGGSVTSLDGGDPVTMEAYHYLKLMITAYHDTRPDAFRTPADADVGVYAGDGDTTFVTDRADTTLDTSSAFASPEKMDAPARALDGGSWPAEEEADELPGPERFVRSAAATRTLEAAAAVPGSIPPGGAAGATAEEGDGPPSAFHSPRSFYTASRPGSAVSAVSVASRGGWREGHPPPKPPTRSTRDSNPGRSARRAGGELFPASGAEENSRVGEDEDRAAGLAEKMAGAALDTSAVNGTETSAPAAEKDAEGEGDEDEDEDDLPGPDRFVRSAATKRRTMRALDAVIDHAAPAPTDAPPPSMPDLNGARIASVRRAISDSCAKYCDVLLQVAQDLPPPVLSQLKAKAVASLDGHSQELFSGALAAFFDVPVDEARGDGAGAVAAAEGGWGDAVGTSEPEVVASVGRSVRALMARDAQAEGGAPEAREVARVVLASRTMRAHVEPLLTRLLSELDDDDEGELNEDERGVVT